MDHSAGLTGKTSLEKKTSFRLKSSYCWKSQKKKAPLGRCRYILNIRRIESDSHFVASEFCGVARWPRRPGCRTSRTWWTTRSCSVAQRLPKFSKIPKLGWCWNLVLRCVEATRRSGSSIATLQLLWPWCGWLFLPSRLWSALRKRGDVPQITMTMVQVKFLGNLRNCERLQWTTGPTCHQWSFFEQTPPGMSA